MRLLFVSGYADRAALQGVAESHIISKPFVDDELGAKVRAALGDELAHNVVRLRRQ
jgi:hypothetical protein